MKLSDKTLLRTRCYIGGQWLSDAHTFSWLEPATGEGLADVADGDRELRERAVESGAWAFLAGRSTAA